MKVDAELRIIQTQNLPEFKKPFLYQKCLRGLAYGFSKIVTLHSPLHLYIFKYTSTASHKASDAGERLVPILIEDLVFQETKQSGRIWD